MWLLLHTSLWPNPDSRRKEAWQQAELANRALCHGIGLMDLYLVGFICRMDVASDRVYDGIAQPERCYVERGGSVIVLAQLPSY